MWVFLFSFGCTVLFVCATVRLNYWCGFFLLLLFFFLLFFLAWSVLFVHALFFVFYLLSPSQAYEAAGLPLFMVCFVCNKEQFYMWVLEIRFSLCLLERMFQTAAQKMKNHYNLLFHLVYLRNALSEAWNRNAIVESRSM